jgi:hypothetical protein
LGHRPSCPKIFLYKFLALRLDFFSFDSVRQRRAYPDYTTLARHIKRDSESSKEKKGKTPTPQGVFQAMESH